MAQLGAENNSGRSGDENGLDAKKISLFARPLIAIIHIYQITLSPWLGNQCRFYPTCSQYAIDALKLHGAAMGSYLTVKRIGRCNQWHEGGEDPVPQRKRK